MRVLFSHKSNMQTTIKYDFLYITCHVLLYTLSLNFLNYPNTVFFTASAVIEAPCGPGWFINGSVPSSSYSDLTALLCHVTTGNSLSFLSAQYGCLGLSVLVKRRALSQHTV